MPKFPLILALAATPLLAHGQSTDPYAGRNIAANCANCHGTNGKSTGGMPSLAGQSADYIARQMREFRDGKRPATIMHQLSKGYTEEQINSVAAYFAAQKSN